MDARELVSPDITDDNFKWRFAMENMRPKLDIQGPGVGSLLYAMNPATSELGLKQMDSELNQQLNANENFDKRGDRALKFMEDRVQEDIARKKMGSVDAGHANSLLSNYTQALQSGDARLIAMAEDQIRRTFPNADAIISQANEQAALGKVQDDRYLEQASKLVDHWDNPEQRKAYISSIQDDINNRLMTRKQGYELIGKANQTPDWDTINKNTNLQAQSNASAGRSVKKKENDLVKQKFDELKAKYPSISDAEAWDRAEEAVGVK